MKTQVSRQLGFSLLEALIAISVMTVALVPAILTVQQGRIRNRSNGYNMIAEHLAVSVMELVKRPGFTQNAYTTNLPDVLDTSTVPSALLDFPRLDSPAAAGGTHQAGMPAGPPGGVTATEFKTFLANYRNSTLSMDEMVSNTVITNNTNYYFFDSDQIAEMNGFTSDDDPALTDEERAKLLDAQYSWGYFCEDIVNNHPDNDAVPSTMDDLRHMVVIVRWLDVRRNERMFTLLESYTVRQAPRLVQ